MFEKKVGRPSNETVKKRRIFKVSMVVLSLAIIGSIVGGLTYARYRTNSQALGNVSIAKWNISLKNGSGQVLSSQNKVTITPIANEDVDTGKVAPGSQFQIQYQIDPADSEVAVETSFTTLKSGFIDVGVPDFNTSIEDVISYNIVSASYTIDGVTTPIVLSEYNDPATVTVTAITAMGNMPIISLDPVYVYPTTPIKIPLSKIQAGKGLTTVTIVVEVDSQYGENNNNNNKNIEEAPGEEQARFRNEILGDNDFLIKLFAAQDTGDNYLANRSNLNFDFIKNYNVTIDTTGNN